MSSHEPSSQPSTDAPAYQTYYVLAADMATYDGDETIRCCQTVLASAQDWCEALDVARNALEEGLAPIAAFGREELLAMIGALTSQPLGPGEAYNLDHLKTDVEMAALREEARASFLPTAPSPAHASADDEPF